MLPRCLARAALLLTGLASFVSAQVTDPRITSWVTTNSAKYARVYETTSDKTSGNAVSTWPRSGLTNGGGGQSTAAYSDVQRVAYSSTYVYIYTTGLPSYTMGNWLTPNGNVYTSWPSNRGAIHRIPRMPSIPTTKQKTNGSGGVLVNGVYVWANGDAQSYTTSTATVSMSGQGIWNRLAGVAEAFNFDPAYGHQPNNGVYHNHINPIGLRYQLGDNVSYNSTTKVYSEAGTPTRHSPIIGWANDGLPIYGPYGYSSAMDATSGIRRLTSGFQKRDGTNGTTNLATTGRTTLPAWAASVQGRSQTLASTEYGPTTTATYQVAPGVTGTYSLGMFAEDYEYLGDVGKTQGTDFDLNRQNVRFGVTPEFPGGTYAYFVCIDGAGATVFPDVINQEFFGAAAMGQGTVTSIAETVTDHVRAGPAATITVAATASGSGVGLAWNSAEGATYRVESSADNATWTTLSSTVTSAGLSTSYSATASAAYFRVTLTAISTYDTNGTIGTPVGTAGTVTYGVVVTAPTITTQPASATVTAGASATFTINASGTGALSYQWRKDSNPISGANSATYTIAATTTSDAGSYTCVVTNSGGSSTSNAAVLTVTSVATAPTITTQPANVTVTAGTSATFTVVASGTAPLSYQWRKDNLAINGATSASFSLTSTTANDAGSYTCVVTNSIGSVTSNAAVLTVNPAATAPTITTQPASVTVTAGTSATFTIVASGTAPLSYQWRKDNLAINGATSASFALSSTTANDAGSYTCVVTNSISSVTSNAATLTVTPIVTAPSIINQPAGATITAGAAITFSVSATGTAPLTYQWRKDGIAINGATAAAYTIASSQTTDTGNYTVIVTNTVGAVTSSAAALTVNPAASAPTITTAPVAASVITGGTATFSVVAAGSGPLNYQWTRGGVPITGATSALLTLANVQTSDAATYAVVVSNSIGSTMSGGASLTVVATAIAPSIVAQPASQTITAGAGATFNVAVNGTAPLTYQWIRNGSPLGGATSATLALTNVQAAQAGTYSLVVTNSAGTATSALATLTVTPASNAPAITSEPADTTVRAGASASFSVAATGTAPLNYQWRKNGAALAGATSATLTITSVAASDAGLYSVVVSNTLGAQTSRAARLTVSGLSYAGAYLGTFPGGSFALHVRGDNSGTFLAYGASTGLAIVARSVTVDDNGRLRFSAVQTSGVSEGRAAAATEWTVDASIASGGAITGTISGGANALGLTATRSATVSGAAALAGLYEGGAVGSGAALYTIVGGDGRAFVLTVNNGNVDAGSGSVDATGRLTGTTASGAAVTATISTASATLAATITSSAGVATVFTGGAETRPSTERLVNLSTRGSASSSPLIVGFVVGGDAARTMLVRAIGPTLREFGVNAALPATRLQIFRGATTIASGADWAATGTSGQIAAAATRVGAFALSTASRDSALLLNLDPGAYTAMVSGADGATGIALVEVYDASENATRTQRLVNLATRAGAGSADGTLIAGFVIAGEVAKRVLIRGAGPALAAFSVSDALANPELRVSSGNTTVATNDDWSRDSATAATIAAAATQVGAFPFASGSRDAALLVYLAPGAYTAQLTGVGGTSGTALIEVYEVP